MSDSCTILSLPKEMLCHVASFLKPQDLLALSATCKWLRSALNNNSVWRKYSNEHLVNYCLENVTSIVPPKFTEPTSSLDSYCQNKLNFLRHSRLIKNYRQGKFIEHSSYFEDGHLTINQIEFTKCSDALNFQQVTYNNEYLFSTGKLLNKHIEYTVVKVSNISKCPCLITYFKPKHLTSFDQKVEYLKVAATMLIVGVSSWIEVYDIKLPSLSFPLKHSIKVEGNFSIVGKFIFNEDNSSKSVLVWDLRSGTKVDTISTKLYGLSYQIEGYSELQQKVLFSVGLDSGSDKHIIPHLYLYDLECLQFTSFDAVLNPDVFQPIHTRNGLIDSSYIVLLSQNCDKNSIINVMVFNRNTSAFVSERTVLSDSLKRSPAITNDGYLILPSLFSIKILSLNDLYDMPYELEVDCGGLIPELPSNFVYGVRYIALSNQCYLIVVSKSGGCMEVWDYETKKKCFQLPDSYVIGINDTLTKLMLLQNVNGVEYLKILNFW